MGWKRIIRKTITVVILVAAAYHLYDRHRQGAHRDRIHRQALPRLAAGALRRTGERAIAYSRDRVLLFSIMPSDY